MSNYAHKTTRTNFKAEKKLFTLSFSYIPFGAEDKGVEVIDEACYYAKNEEDAKTQLPSIIGRDWGEFTFLGVVAC